MEQSMPTSQNMEHLLALTPLTIERVKEMISHDPQARGKHLRIAVESGSCNSYQYGFSFDDQKKDDIVETNDGLSILIDSESAKFLKGSILDYKEDFGNSGFTIRNPQVKKSCGCGQSFDI
jgi:iron-sulfur cluster assembly accessory protein